jgi:hypothetical protein
VFKVQDFSVPQRAENLFTILATVSLTLGKVVAAWS